MSLLLDTIRQRMGLTPQEKPQEGSMISPIQNPRMDLIRERLGLRMGTKEALKKTFTQDFPQLFRATREILIPKRGFTEEEIAEAQPTTKEKALAIPKFAAEFASVIGELLGRQSGSLVQKTLETKTGQKLADVGGKIKQFAILKTAGEAKAMRFVDVATFLPIGSLKISVTGAETIARSKNVLDIFNVLKKEIPELSDEAAKGMSVIFKEIDNADDVQRAINKIKFAGQQTRKTKLATEPQLHSPIRMVGETKVSIPTFKNAYDKSRPLIIGKFGDKTYTTDSILMELEDVGLVKTSEQTPKSEQIAQLLDSAKKNTNKLSAPYGYAEIYKGSPTLAFKTLSGNVYLQSRYYNYLSKKYPDLQLIAKDGTSPVAIYSGDELKGLVMPTREVNDVKPLIYGQETGGVGDITLSAKKTIDTFEQSTNQEILAELENIKFELGSYGRNALERKVTQPDRITIPEAKEVLANITTAYKAGNDAFRKDNIVWVAKMSGGELRAVVTRQNKSGAEEVINAFKVGRDPKNFIENLRKFGVPERIRTAITGLEDQGFNPLAYEDIIKIAKPESLVKQVVPISPIEAFRGKSTSLKAIQTEKALPTSQKIQKVSLADDAIKTTKVNTQVAEAVKAKDPLNLNEDALKPVGKEPELITTRKFKQTDEWKDFAKYAEENLQGKDIHPAIFNRHITMTAERVAEFLDGGIGGKTYNTIVKPVYEAAENIAKEGNAIKNEVDSFRILEGSSLDKEASLFAQKKLDDASPKAKVASEYVRNKYDEFLDRLNKTRAKLGVEPIPKKENYVTHINELNVLSELFGGVERITIKRRISELKSELLDLHPDWTDARAFDAAKRQIEGLTGLEKYVDARQPIFKFAKKRLSEYEADPSIIRSFNTYTQNALRYIHQAENVARNKAFKDVLPANSKEFMRLWNTEQVAGRQPPSMLNPTARRALSAVRGTLGANTILGNLATTMMQLTSFPQVVALAGFRNTLYGIGSRLRSYIPGLTNIYDASRTKAIRNLDVDIGLGDSLIDQLLIKIGKHDILRNPTARTRQAVDIGRQFLKAIMQIADQFTVGASYQAFYRKGVLDGLTPQKAMEFADIMTGKTQANYFKEALPPFLNTVEGKTVGQFGVYGMNQWEMFKRDFGKEFKLNEKNSKSIVSFFKQFLVFLVSAYVIDSLSEKTFGRQPYEVKNLVDDAVGFATGDITGKQLFDSSKDAVATYVPFAGSVKFGSMPPVIEFGKDMVGAVLGTGQTQKDAIKQFSDKWIYNILLPYGGNQLRKTLQGVEEVTDVDLPFVRNTSKNVDIETNIDKARALLFGPYATEAAREYFEERGAPKSDYDKAIAEQNKIRAQDKARIMPIYDKAQKLLLEGKTTEAKALVDALSDDEYEIYKSIKQSEKTKRTNELKEQMFPIFQRNQELIKSGKKEEAQRIVDGLSDEKYRAYQLIKKQFLERESLKSEIQSLLDEGRSKKQIARAIERMPIEDKELASSLLTQMA